MKEHMKMNAPIRHVFAMLCAAKISPHWRAGIFLSWYPAPSGLLWDHHILARVSFARSPSRENPFTFSAAKVPDNGAAIPVLQNKLHWSAFLGTSPARAAAQPQTSHHCQACPQTEKISTGNSTWASYMGVPKGHKTTTALWFVWTTYRHLDSHWSS